MNCIKIVKSSIEKYDIIKKIIDILCELLKISNFRQICNKKAIRD